MSPDPRLRPGRTRQVMSAQYSLNRSPSSGASGLRAYPRETASGYSGAGSLPKSPQGHGQQAHHGHGEVHQGQEQAHQGHGEAHQGRPYPRGEVSSTTGSGMRGRVGSARPNTEASAGRMQRSREFVPPENASGRGSNKQSGHKPRE